MAQYKEWFKVIQNGTLVGVTTNECFARYSAKSKRIHICDAINGQYVVLKDKYYHDAWMLPIDPNARLEYEDAQVIGITEKEYDMLNSPLPETAVELVDHPDISEEKAEQRPTENDLATLAFVRKNKIKALSAACEQAIEDGFDIALSDGAKHHFSLTAHDQFNLMTLKAALDADDDLIYHADGELMQYYSSEDAQAILIGATRWKDYNLAVYNSMKHWINNLEDISVIDAITYDSEIPDEYTTVVLQSLAENF